jgi:Phage P22-like portal protein
MIDNVKNFGSWSLYDNMDNDWLTKDDIRIAEYFYKVYEKKTLYQVRDNRTGELIITTAKPPKEIVETNIVTILNERPTHECEIHWCLLTCEEILQDSIFQGQYIPIVPVYGEDYWVNGKRYVCGAVRRAKDAQKLLNFTTSLQAEIIDLNAKAPYIGAAGQFDTFEDNWRDANRKNFGYLEYNTVDINGTPVQAPQRNAVEAPIQAVQATKMAAVEDIKAIFGIFDASLGANGNETSGVAILARKQQSGVSNYHYYDNLVRSVKQIGRILVDVIPAYYDTPRMVRIIKPNGEQEMAAINQLSKQGKMVDLSTGRYDVTVQTGPAYATRRQEMVESGINLINAYPNAAPLIADVVADQMDFEGAKIMAKRLRAAVPPEILQATNEDSDMDAEAQVQALSSQLKQTTMQLKALNAHAAQVEQELKLEKEEKILLKMKQDVEIKKAEMDQNVKLKGFELDEQKTELDFLIKEQELIIQQRQIALEEAKLQIMGVQTAAEIDDNIFQRKAEHFERVGKFNAPDDAQPSDLTAPPSGL